MVELKGDERLDYIVADEKVRIIQSPSIFSYSLDALLLGHFASIPIAKGNILDLCSGNGVIPLLLSNRTKAKITGLEIQERLVDMAERSIQLNKLEDQLQVLSGDLKVRHKEIPQSFFNTVTCNPPYFKATDDSHQNESEYMKIARHEICCTLVDVIQACKLYVRPGGKVAIVHRPERLVDLITLSRKYALEPKRIQFVYPKKGKESNTLLFEAIRDGKSGTKILPPLYVYEDDNTYTEEARKIIYGEK